MKMKEDEKLLEQGYEIVPMNSDAANFKPSVADLRLGQKTWLEVAYPPSDDNMLY